MTWILRIIIRGILMTYVHSLQNKKKYLAAAILLALMMLLSGCATWLTPLNQETFYRYDMWLNVNGQDYEGVAVVPQAPSYLVRVESLEDMDMLALKSCSRETPIPGAIKQGWFKQRRGYEFEYIPNSLEREPGCPLHLGGYDKKNGRHSWGYIYFNTNAMKLDAWVTCNGQSELFADGAGACQSHAGLEQLLRFKAPVEYADNVVDPKCRLPQSPDGKTWRFNMPHGICIYEFMEIGGKGDIFHFTTIGYDQIVIRGQ